MWGARCHPACWAARRSPARERPCLGTVPWGPGTSLAALPPATASSSYRGRRDRHPAPPRGDFRGLRAPHPLRADDRDVRPAGSGSPGPVFAPPAGRARPGSRMTPGRAGSGGRAAANAAGSGGGRASGPGSGWHRTCPAAARPPRPAFPGRDAVSRTGPARPGRRAAGPPTTCSACFYRSGQYDGGDPQVRGAAVRQWNDLTAWLGPGARYVPRGGDTAASRLSLDTIARKGTGDPVDRPAPDRGPRVCTYPSITRPRRAGPDETRDRLRRRAALAGPRERDPWWGWAWPMTSDFASLDSARLGCSASGCPAAWRSPTTAAAATTCG